MTESASAETESEAIASTSSASASSERRDVDASDDVADIEEDMVATLESIKTKGNALFKEKDFNLALMKYSEACTLYTDHIASGRKPGANLRKLGGAVFNNRAMCYFRLELFNAAVEDSKMAIKQKFWKGYYRRGCSYAAMGKWSKAKKDFASAKKKFPKSKDIKAKLRQATEAHTYEKFSKAIATEHYVPKSLSLHSERYGEPPSSYDGPRFDSIDDIDEAWVLKLMDFFKTGGTLHLKYVAELMLKVLKIFESYPNVVRYSLPKDGEDAKATAEDGDDAGRSVSDMREMDEGEEKEAIDEQRHLLDSKARKITVCGDVHGQYYDFLNIFQLNGTPSVDNPYLFNGDFVDRGSWSVEVILTMFAWKVVLGDHFMMTRGNHEAINMNVMYGFKGEVEHKLNKDLFDLFTEIFNAIPLAFVLGEKVFVCHGGLFQQDGVTIEKLNSIDRKCQPSEGNTNPPELAEIMADLLWSDPQDMSGRAPSKRGGGTMFGPDITRSFLELNGLELLIRSHEVQEDGYSVVHDGQLITIFSAPNYVDSMGNMGAYITLDSDYKPTFTTFDAVEHPDVKPMAYARGPLSFMNFM
jgi:serine/threonine-protein phosphatase 5